MPSAPVATYRLQLNAGFTFKDAAGIAEFLADLGVSHVYCSPVLQATAGSTHGYDVVDPTRVSEELGGVSGFRRLSEALRQNRLKLLLDIVPNHMAASASENPWWRDLLENGRDSKYACFFAVDLEASGDGRILLPVLGDHIGRVLAAGEIRLCREGGVFTIRYFDKQFPVDPLSLGALLQRASRSGESDSLAAVSEELAARSRPRPPEDRMDAASLRARLADICAPGSEAARLIDAAIAEWNSDPALLDDLLARQHYRLAYWRLAGEELGYRRFFDIDSLIGLRIEDERVFAASHGLVLGWVNQGCIDGLRVDHPDGLRDPEGYLRRLREAAPQAWIIVEKILEPGESLPATWPVAGTSGYDFLNRLNGLFIDPAGEESLTAFYQEFTGQSCEYPALRHEKKLLVLRDVLGSDLNRLVALLRRICGRHRRHRDYTRRQLEDALSELVASFPVYRTYVRTDPPQVSAEDERRVGEAVELAGRHRPDLDPELLGFLRDLLLLRLTGEEESDFAMRFQQLTGPAMAKGVEDTAFYCYNRLVSLNEVGGDPGQFGVPVGAFHRFCTETQRRWPRTMLATSTHDTKRSEDVRARINLLSEIPATWIQAVRRWTAINARHCRAGLPDRNTEYLIYQTLVGTWPINEQRLAAYVRKAAREAKMYTSWHAPNTAYEQALADFVSGILSDEAFVADLEAFIAPLIGPGRINALAATLLKLTAPGVPDIYQGMELWDLSLVDPDNRRPVDYALRSRLLNGIKAGTSPPTLSTSDEGLPKLWLLSRALALRRRLPQALAPEASYQPLEASGRKAGHVVAFLRGGSVVSAAPRLVVGLGDDWGDTTITVPDGSWRNAFSDQLFAGPKLRISELTEQFPIVLLSREEER